jgi:four helix bundle protein
MTENNKKIYDLEERTYQFAKSAVIFCKKLPKNKSNEEFCKQLIRSAGSIGANYIEANESLGRKDFFMRIKISRKEAKESAYWLRLLIETNDQGFIEEGAKLINEAIEFKNIFSSIIIKSRTK